MEKALVGIWKHPNPQFSYFVEHGEDGSYYQHHPYDKDYYNSYRGVYKIVGPDKIDGYKLIITLDNGNESEHPISVEEGSYTIYGEDPENPEKTLEIEYKQRITKDTMEDHFAEMGLIPNPLLALINNKKLSAKTITENKIVTGVWEAVDYYFFIDFKQNGTYVSNSDFSDGLYKVDRNKLILKDMDGEEWEVTFSVEGDVLVTNAYGDETEFIRSTKEAMFEYFKNGK